MPMTAPAMPNAPPRAGRLLFAAVALAEITVGLLAIGWPQILGLLLAASLDAAGLMVARMLGAAIFALGLTWWFARSDDRGPARNAPGFLLYNVGVGVLFAMQALAVAQPALPWIVALAHLGAALGFIALKPHGNSPKAKEQP